MTIISLPPLSTTRIYSICNHYIYIYIYMCVCVCKVKLATVVEVDPKAPFSIATIAKCMRECYSLPWIAPFYPWYVPYNAES